MNPAIKIITSSKPADVVVSKSIANGKLLSPSSKLLNGKKLTPDKIILEHCLKKDVFMKEMSGAKGFFKEKTSVGKNYNRAWSSYDKKYNNLINLFFKNKQKALNARRLKRYSKSVRFLEKKHGELRQTVDAVKGISINIAASIVGTTAQLGTTLAASTLGPAVIPVSYANSYLASEGMATVLKKVAGLKKSSIKDHINSAAVFTANSIAYSGAKLLPGGFVTAPFAGTIAECATQKAVSNSKINMGSEGLSTIMSLAMNIFARIKSA